MKFGLVSYIMIPETPALLLGYRPFKMIRKVENRDLPIYAKYKTPFLHNCPWFYRSYIYKLTLCSCLFAKRHKAIFDIVRIVVFQYAMILDHDESSVQWSLIKLYQTIIITHWRSMVHLRNLRYIIQWSITSSNCDIPQHCVIIDKVINSSTTCLGRFYD